MISSPISSIHHKGHTKYVTIKLTGTLNNTTLSPPLLFSPYVSGNGEVWIFPSGSNNSSAGSSEWFDIRYYRVLPS